VSSEYEAGAIQNATGGSQSKSKLEGIHLPGLNARVQKSKDAVSITQLRASVSISRLFNAQSLGIVLVISLFILRANLQHVNCSTPLVSMGGGLPTYNRSRCIDKDSRIKSYHRYGWVEPLHCLTLSQAHDLNA